MSPVFETYAIDNIISLYATSEYSLVQGYIFVSLQRGQVIVFKGMVIGIYKSPDLFNREHFGLVFAKNFTHSQIQQKIEDRDSMETDDSRRSFHTAITY